MKYSKTSTQMSNIGTSDLQTLPVGPNSEEITMTIREKEPINSTPQYQDNQSVSVSQAPASQAPASQASASQAPVCQAPVCQVPISQETHGNETANVIVPNAANKLQEQRKSDPSVQQNKIVTDIQSASQQGLLALSPRDIPTTTTQITQDEKVDVSFIPKTDIGDYINEQMTAEEIINRNAKKTDIENKSDAIFTEISLPILVAVLYFTFQLPVVRKNIARIFPIICKNDGNFKLSGYLMISIIFGASVYAANKATQYLSV